MRDLERRQTPRTTIGNAFINIEPNNGGIVLNVSDSGLCFHSFDPVERNGTIRFWFLDNNHRIEAAGALAWMDETQKGGLRFTALPVEAREKIRDWMSQAIPPLGTGQKAAAASLAPRVFPTLSESRPEIKAVSVVSGPLEVVATELKLAKPSSGFSRGLATGLLVSVVVVAGVLFQSYRREIGESLIRLGERFASKPQAETLTASSAVPTVLAAAPSAAPSAETFLPAPQKVVPPAAAIPVPQPQKAQPKPEKVASQPVANPVAPQPVKVEPARPAPVATTAALDPAPKPATAAAPPIGLTAPAISSPTTTLAPSASPSAGKPVVVAKLEPAKLETANQPGVHSEGSDAANADLTRELYFEVGKFKNPLQAQDETDRLTQLGLPVTGVQKGFLWTNSYHVLVGPYADEGRAQATQETLVSSGFKPRPFEKGSRNFTLLSSLTLNGSQTPQGDYTITWESYIGDASVKLVHNSSVVASADGRWVKRETKYPRDAYVYRRNADGSRTLLEIHFGGMRQALVFGKAS